MQGPLARVINYRLRAEEIRTAAQGMANAESRATFLRVARDYDMMAGHLEAKHDLPRTGETVRYVDVAPPGGSSPIKKQP